MFFNPTHMLKEAYISFWDKLGRGEFDSGEYKRLCKSGKDIYIQATDNPIFDVNGKPIKIVKFVIDVTES